MEKKFSGKIWKFGNDIDTDTIIPGKRGTIPDRNEMKKYAFELLKPEFGSTVQPGDILVAGTNFGCGSSREHAPIALLNMGASAVIADSFARIFFRNSINLGLPLIVCKGISKEVENGQELTLDIEKGTVTVKETGKVYPCDRLGDQAMKILEAGGIKPMMRARMEKEKAAQ